MVNGTLHFDSACGSESKGRDYVVHAEMVMSMLSMDTLPIESYGSVKKVFKCLNIPPVNRGCEFISGVLSSVNIVFDKEDEHTEFVKRWVSTNSRKIISSCASKGYSSVLVESDKISIDPSMYIVNQMGVSHTVTSDNKVSPDDTRVTLVMNSCLTAVGDDIYEIGLPMYIGGCVEFALAHQLRAQTTSTKGAMSNLNAVTYGSQGASHNMALASGLIEETASSASQSLLNATGNVVSVNATRDDVDIQLPVSHTADYSDFEFMTSIGMLSGPVPFAVAWVSDKLARDILEDATNSAVFDCKSYFPKVSEFISKVVQRFLSLNESDAEFSISLKVHPSELKLAGSALNSVALAGVLTTNELRELAGSLLSMNLEPVDTNGMENPNRT